MTSPPMTGAEPPLLEIDHVSRVYGHGEGTIRALDDVSLSIAAGEFVAIVGPSGSGKSTLMNVLGCLDRPSGGHYRVAGRDVAELDGDGLAALRRDRFGFVFQRYNLLATATAAENVEIPTIYAGRSRDQRHERAHALLARLGLADRAGHRPGELSGGQQQRVSIARALVNGAEIILADEPTGALDAKSGRDVLALLAELNREGRTIILITHDAAVAAHARRTIRIEDGRIVSDSGAPATVDGAAAPRAQVASRSGLFGLATITEAVRMALRSLRVNLFRATLTLLGVVIGVAAVVAMLAIGNGSRDAVLERIQRMGTNLLIVLPGAPGTRPSGDLATLTLADADAIAALPGVEAVDPQRSTRSTLRAGSIDYQSSVQGSGVDFASVRDWPLAEGTFFNRTDLDGYAPVAVLGATVAQNLFPRGDPIGRYVLIQNVPFEVIGVLTAKGASAGGQNQDDVAVIPVTTGFMRLFGQRYLGNLTVKVGDVGEVDAVEAAIERELATRHQTVDFQIRNTASLIETASATFDTLTMLLGSVAAISLLVGGIGVMNIMLVSVTERTREIGIRMAAGARMRDILMQFNTEAVVVCGIGGIVGVALGLGIGLAAANLGIPASLTVGPPLLAFACAFSTGLVFGYLPARKAARLDPVVALASE
jgi:macrolide transport system ATP-binding/permease protein